jgi:hypothetical protein
MPSFECEPMIKDVARGGEVSRHIRSRIVYTLVSKDDKYTQYKCLLLLSSLVRTKYKYKMFYFKSGINIKQ